MQADLTCQYGTVTIAQVAKAPIPDLDVFFDPVNQVWQDGKNFLREGT